MKRRLLRWTGRILLVALTVLLVLGVRGWLWERAEHRAFVEADLRGPGTMVTVGDRVLHVMTVGEGSPGVLLVSGLGDDTRSWNTVQDGIGEVTRVVSYDRPGLGWSPEVDGPVDVDAALRDIAALIGSGLFDGPPVLVGHSLGGLLARRFAYRYPGRIAGLILIEPTPEQRPLAMTVIGGAIYRLRSLWASVGLSRRALYRAYPQLSREDQLRWGHLNASAALAHVALRELRGASGSEPFEPPLGGLDSLPLAVFVGRVEAPPILGSTGRQLRERMVATAGESSQGRLIEVDTGHYVHRELPDRVIEAVIGMVTTVRGSAPDA